MRTRSDRRPNRKNDRKVLVAEKSTKSWADTDSESSSSSSSSSDSEQEEVHCFMADQASVDEVFDFSNVEFTREDLTVNTYIAMNHTIDARGQSDELGVADVADVAVVKRKYKSKKKSETTDETPVEIISVVAGSKKRPAAEDSAPVIPKKRHTVKGKAILDVVPIAQDVVPLQIIEPTPAATVVKSPAPNRISRKRRLVLPTGSDDEIMDTQETVKDTDEIAEKHTDEIDDIIGQITVETSKMGSDEKELEEQRVDETDIGDDFDQWLEESFKDFVENEPVRGNPAKETVELICGDVDFLVQLRDKVMTDVVDFFHSFSLNKLSDFDGLRDLKEKEKLMLSWAETEFLETAVKRRMYILAKYREMLLRKFLDSHRRYFALGQPWTKMASHIISLLSVSHSKSLEVLLAQQKEHGIIKDRPRSSQHFKDLADNSGALLAQFYSMAKSTCWARPMILVNGVWTPIQGNDFWRSSCRLSLFVNRRQEPESVVDIDFVPHALFIEPVQYWGAAPSLIKTWGWARVCTEIFRYCMFGCLRPGEVSSSRPQPPPDDQSRGSVNTGGGGDTGGGDTVRTTEIAQRDIDNAQRDILERFMAADRQRERERVKFSRNNTIRSTAKVAVNRDVHIRVTRDRDIIIRYRYSQRNIYHYSVFNG
ncbi:protein arginine N-methyltransferase 1.5-like [Dorcoceras hygrometricum]|uniref:Protein arginine N-methyltransferase 1.5-like n=1 Tax=Dorcoceras hygrometricum TaxID=472368 RepID=A0A2Z7D3D9_9LAMI|nr:protein arginine N-methyltransferase 1.5-like [Dorcoceras hygrometricum]